MCTSAWFLDGGTSTCSIRNLSIDNKFGLTDQIVITAHYYKHWFTVHRSVAYLLHAMFLMCYVSSDLLHCRIV